METITIAVRNAESGREYDFEVPADQPISDVALAIVQALNWNMERTWRVETPSRRSEGYLDGKATLAELGLWDGSLLVFQDHDPTRLIQEDQQSSIAGQNYIFIGGDR